MVPNGASWELRLKELDKDSERVLVAELSSKTVPYPAMRPDGLKVAFSAEENGQQSIFLVDTASDLARKSCERICEGCGTPLGWSPDGANLLYYPYDRPAPEPICLLQVETREKIDVAKHPEYSLLGAQFSPDGQWISCQGVNESKNGGIFIVPYKQGTLAKLSDFIEVTGGEPLDYSACWSSDGSLLYFIGPRDGYGSCIWAQRLHRLTKRPIGKPFVVLHDHITKSDKMAKHVAQMWLSQGGNKLFFSTSKVTASIWMMQLKNLD